MLSVFDVENTQTTPPASKETLFKCFALHRNLRIASMKNVCDELYGRCVTIMSSKVHLIPSMVLIIK